MIKTKSIIFLFLILFARAATANDRSILVAGDSWAYLLCFDKSFEKVLNEYEPVGLVPAGGCLNVSKIGIEASEWLASRQHSKLMDMLARDPSMAYLHLSLGGNDLLNRWNVNMPVVEEMNLFYSTYSHILNVIDEVQKQTSAKVILSGYDFPRFIPDHPVSQYNRMYERLGKPEAKQLNGALIRFHLYLYEKLKQRRDFNTKFFYISHIGLAHYYTGIPDAKIPPKTTLHPDEISTLENPDVVGGAPDFLAETDLQRMYLPGIYDPFHMSRMGNQYLAEHTLRNVIFPTLD